MCVGGDPLGALSVTLLRGSTWVPFYKPLVPGAPAHTGVGKGGRPSADAEQFHGALSGMRAEVGALEAVTSHIHVKIATSV